MSIWNKPSRYGTYEGERGSPSQWRNTFAAMSGDEARVIIEAAKETPWSLLGIEPTDDLKAIKSAYRKRMLEVHPDRGGSEEAAKKVIAAWTLIEETLK